MKKKKLAALFMCIAGLVFALTGASCAKDDAVAWSFDAAVPVACEEGERVDIALTVQGVTDYTVGYEVTVNGASVETEENGAFTPTVVGEYVIKITVTHNGASQEKSYTLTVIKDATAPVVTVPIADKTAEKGEYNFTADLASIVAADNKTAPERIKKSLVSVTLDNQSLTVTENVCTFSRAGQYTVRYKVEDEEGNAADFAYTITVSGLYLNEKTFESETFQLAAYTIADVDVYGYTDARVSVVLTQDGESKQASLGETVKFIRSSPVTLTYSLFAGEQEKDTIEKTITVKALDLLLSETDFNVTEGDEIVIPTASLSHATDGVLVTVTVSGQYQEEKRVQPGDKLTVASGVTDIVFTASNEDGTFTVSRQATVVATGKDEIISFEKVGAGNPDFNVPPNGDRIKNEQLNEDPAFVKSGKYSAKLIFGENRPNKDVYNAGFLYWDNQVRNASVQDANGLSMWIYSEKQAYIVACIATGAGNYSGAKTSHGIELNQGWNNVEVNFDYQIYCRGTLDAKNGISELFFYHVVENADAILAANGGNVSSEVIDGSPLEIYLDEVRLKKLAIPDGIYFTFDSVFPTAGTLNDKVTVPEPRRLITEGVTFTVTILDPDGTSADAATGDEFVLAKSGRYRITYKAEKEGSPSQEESFEILVPAVGEFFSFESVNGVVKEMTYDRIGNEQINNDTQYVQSGAQSVKLLFGENRLDTGNVGAGFLPWEGNRIMPTVDGATGITMWVYAEVEVYLYVYIGTGGGESYCGGKQAKPVALKTGWNFISIDARYDMSEIGINLADGISELFFRLGDASGFDFGGNSTGTLYLDSVCFAALPEREIENVAIDYTNVALPGDVEFGGISLCSEEPYTRDGKPSLKLEMTANEAENQSMRACYSAWGKGILLTNGENAVTFDVYSSRDAFVSFEFGTGGNAGGGAYSGAKFSKILELKAGWNTVTLTFDASGSAADVNGANLADGIVHFGSTAVNSLESAVVGNDHYVAVATEPLTLYVSTMVAVQA